jgi:predicted ArsR family transcriptional regulator
MYVLLCVARQSDIRVREIATKVGITERRAQAILRDLQEGGFVEAHRVGRRNEYRVTESARFPNQLLAHAEVGPVLKLLNQLLDCSDATPEEDAA